MASLSSPTPREHRRSVRAVLAELRGLSTVQDRLDQYAATRFGINRTDLRALDLIGQGQALSPTALSNALGMSTGATSAVLDRLEAAGYARRAPDPAHRRRTQVRLTPAAEELAATIFDPLIATTLAQLAAYPDTVLSAAAKLLTEHRAQVEDYLRAHDTDADRTDADRTDGAR